MTNTPASGLLVVWRVVDGKRGHENQTQGLCAALARRVAVQQHDIPVTSRWHGWHSLLFGADPLAGLPAPQLILGAGHATHPLMLALRRRNGGRTVVLMKPSLPIALFDLCVLPRHDQTLIHHANTVITLGALNTVMPGQAHNTGKGLILLGGRSAHAVWEPARLLQQIRTLLAQDQNVHWQISDSRRTPAGMLDPLAGLALPNVTITPHAQTPPGWIAARLAEAAQVWITPDSVSMIYEALTAGCRVGVFDLPINRATRVAHEVRRLKTEGRVTAFADWQQRGELSAAQLFPSQADHVAGEILRLLFTTR